MPGESTAWLPLTIEILDACIADCARAVMLLPAKPEDARLCVEAILMALTGDKRPEGQPFPNPDWRMAQFYIAHAEAELCRGRHSPGGVWDVSLHWVIVNADLRYVLRLLAGSDDAR